jgi:hypothetical protein
MSLASETKDAIAEHLGAIKILVGRHCRVDLKIHYFDADIYIRDGVTYRSIPGWLAFRMGDVNFNKNLPTLAESSTTTRDEPG